MAYPASIAGRLCRRGRLAGLGILGALIALAVAPAAALAAPPANDAFLTAAPLSGTSATASASNQEATKETGEPNHAYSYGGHSIWYRWVAPSDGAVAIDTFGSNFDTVLGVYTGATVEGLTVVASNDQAGGNQSAVRFGVIAGRTYMIAVDGWSGSRGNVALHLLLSGKPANDDFASAEELSGPQASATGDTSGAVSEPGEPGAGWYPAHASVWYSWTAPETAGATIDTAGSGFNTVLAVYTGTTVSGLVSVASNDDASSATKTSRVAFRAIAGTTYRIAVDGSSGAFGEVKLNLRTRAPPANDQFSNAVALPGDGSVAASGFIDGASTEIGEPSHHSYYAPRSSVWYSWTAPKSGSLTIRATADFDSVVAAYTGTQVGGLTRVANQAQYPPPGANQIRLRVSAGTTYRIAVDSLGTASGDFSLTLALVDSPPNDDFADAIPLDGLSADVDGTNVGATQQRGEPIHDDNYYDPSVWYSWTAPADETVTLDLSGSDLWAVVAVYTGTDVAALTRVPSSRPTTLKRRFHATAGVTYRIAVDGAQGRQGTFHLALRAGPPPPNDMFAGATSLTGTDASATTSTAEATAEPGEPQHSRGGARASVWFRWTAPSDGGTTIDTAGSNFDTVLAVYTGDSVSGLSAVANNNDVSYSTYTSRLTFRAVGGTTYRIAVDGSWADSYGNAALTLRHRPVPDNDLFANATVLDGGANVAASGRNDGASAEIGEPSHHDWYQATSSVWYAWTAPSSGSLTIKASAPGFSAALAAYTGDSVSELTRVPTQVQYPWAGPDQIRIRVTAGKTYRIALDTASSGSGDFSLSLQLVESPPNDDFSAATPLAGLSADVDGTNVGATQEPGEPIHDQNYYDPSVWYSWTAPADETVTLDLAGSELQAVIGVYTGDSVSTLNRVATNRSFAAPQPRHRFRATSGTTYRIAIDGAQGRQGNFHLKLRAGPVPANDAFAAAQELTGADASVTGDSTWAWHEAGEPWHAYTNGAASVWYSWTAPADGGVTIDTAGSAFDTVLAAYTGDQLSGLIPVASNNDASAVTTTSRVSFRAQAGVTYRIAIDGPWADAAGAIELHLHLRPPPGNDLFANAVVLDGAASVTAGGRNDGASSEPGEPSHYAWTDASNSVWYSWTAPSSGSLMIAAEGNAGAIVAVYSGDQVSDLGRVAAQAQYPTPPANRIRVRVVAGVTYRIAVDAWAGYGGDFSLQLALIGSPPNDDFVAATPLVGLSADVDGTNVGATQEPGEPVHDDNYYYDPSVWYSWTAPAAGAVSVGLPGSALDGGIGVYTGDSVGSLTRVNSSRATSDGRTLRYFRAAAGVTYRIAVDGPEARQSTFHLALRLMAPPANDDFANAQELTGAVATADGSNVGATGEPDDPSPGGTAGASVWYRWTAPDDGAAQLSLPSHSFTPGMTVYSGDELGSLSQVAVSRWGDPLRFHVSAGTTYRFGIDGGTTPDRGTFAVRVKLVDAPPNDDFVAATEISGASATVTGSNEDASREPGEPDHHATYYGSSIWYRWTAPASGRTSVSTVGSTATTSVSVYTGDSVDALTAVQVLGAAWTPRDVKFEATEGTTYRIAVDNFYGSTGAVKLSVLQAPAPANDDFANAAQIPVGATTSSNAGASRGAEDTWLSSRMSGATVWFRWTAPTDGPVVVDTNGTAFGTLSAAYSGSAGSLYYEGADFDPDDGQGSMWLWARAGETYLIVVDGVDGAEGDLALNLNYENTSSYNGPYIWDGGEYVLPGEGGQPGGSAPPPPAAVTFAPKRQKLRSVLAKGLLGVVDCSGPCMINASAQLGSVSRYGLRGTAATVGRAGAQSSSGQPVRVAIALPKPAIRKLKKAKSVKVTVSVRALIGEHEVSVKRTLTIRR
jgi:hypothetical protein